MDAKNIEDDKIAKISGLSVEEICYIISDSEKLFEIRRKRKEGDKE